MGASCNGCYGTTQDVSVEKEVKNAAVHEPEVIIPSKLS